MANYRTYELPDVLKDYIKSNYKQFWGSIYLYAPEIQPHLHRLSLKFAGIYCIEAGEGKTITINGRKYESRQTVFLKSGDHTYSSNFAFRLRLNSENILKLLDERYEIERPFFPNVYTH